MHVPAFRLQLTESESNANESSAANDCRCERLFIQCREDNARMRAVAGTTGVGSDKADSWPLPIVRQRVKPSARRALGKSDALYLSSLGKDGIATRRQFAEWRAGLAIDLSCDELPILTGEDVSEFVRRVSAQRIC